MKILFVTPFFPPLSNCGSDSYLLSLIKHFTSQGNDCRVLLVRVNPPPTYTFNGIEVYGKDDNFAEHFKWSDVVFCHLGISGVAIFYAKICGKPVYHIAHNTSPLENIRRGGHPVNIIYNSQDTADKLAYPHPSFVLYPIVDTEDYQTGVNPEESEYITMIGLSLLKGSDTFYKLAELMPERRFLGVHGSYGVQVIKDLPNVRHLENSTDILPAYRQTRILIMPSDFESFGMTAREAMCSGIPVICSDIPALRENCGDAAIYCNRNKADEWVEAIRYLDDKKTYLYQSELCKKRAYNSDTTEQLNALDDFLKVGR